MIIQRAMIDYDPKEIGRRIREVRVRRGYSQEQLAKRADMHWTYIGRIERGQSGTTGKTIGVKTLVMICDALEVSPNEILRYEPIKYSRPKQQRIVNAYRAFEKSTQTAKDLAILVDRLLRLANKK